MSPHDPERTTYASDMECDRLCGRDAETEHPDPRSDEMVCRVCLTELTTEE